jgi:hypothetical protein
MQEPQFITLNILLWDAMPYVPNETHASAIRVVECLSLQF